MDKPRIQVEQIAADDNFLKGLETSLNEWQDELVFIEKELIDQALIDAREKGEPSTRYKTLEDREKYLKKSIDEARVKLGKVAERTPIGPLSGLLNTALNNVKP